MRAVLCCACFGLYSFCAEPFALHQQNMGCKIAVVRIVVRDVGFGAL